MHPSTVRWIYTSADRIAVTRCVLCGDDEPRLMFREPPHSVVRCRRCSLVWVTPRLPDSRLPEVYGETYWSSDSPRDCGYGDYRGAEPLYLKTHRRRLPWVESHLVGPGRRVLDVGCAAGYFMKVASDAGWEVSGIELNRPIAEHARSRFGFERLHVGTVDDAPFPPGSFDLVTLWDVAEHVPDPVHLLERCRELLCDSGTLMLTTQNVDSRFARMLGRRWWAYKHDEHLYHFGPASLTRLLNMAGFEVIVLTPRRGGKYISFEFIAERAGKVHPALSTLLRPLALFKRANVYLYFRDEMLVVARPTA